MKIGGWAPIELHDHEQEEVARDHAEGIRLAYVAATRARDLLVVPALGDEPWEGGWISPLNRALYPPAASRRDSARGPRCPAFRSKDTVLERPNDETAAPSTVCPGLHAMPGGYSVVWWDPGALSLGARPPFGVRRDDLIVKDVPRDVVAEGRSRYDRWRLARLDARASGAVPSLTVQTVKEWAADGSRELPAPASRIEITVVDTSPSRTPGGATAGGADFGMVVHGTLARAQFGAARAELEELARLEARVLGLDEALALSAAASAERVLQHALLDRARAADARGACRRETPITYRLADGELVEGVVDLAFEEGRAWTVVDYKTDREIAEEGEEQYRRQIALYAAAIAEATGQPARAVLLRV
jgi:ATP-dependent exoDNAse (exonuclease V) beta subunit